MLQIHGNLSFCHAWIISGGGGGMYQYTRTLADPLIIVSASIFVVWWLKVNLFIIELANMAAGWDSHWTLHNQARKAQYHAPWVYNRSKFMILISLETRVHWRLKTTANGWRKLLVCATVSAVSFTFNTPCILLWCGLHDIVDNHQSMVCLHSLYIQQETRVHWKLTSLLLLRISGSCIGTTTSSL